MKIQSGVDGFICDCQFSMIWPFYMLNELAINIEKIIGELPEGYRH